MGTHAAWPRYSEGIIISPRQQHIHPHSLPCLNNPKLKSQIEHACLCVCMSVLHKASRSLHQLISSSPISRHWPKASFECTGLASLRLGFGEGDDKWEVRGNRAKEGGQKQKKKRRRRRRAPTSLSFALDSAPKAPAARSSLLESWCQAGKNPGKTTKPRKLAA